MLKRILLGMTFSIFFISLTATASALTWDEYWDNMGKDYVRGTKNILGSPLQVYHTYEEWASKETGNEYYNRLAGTVDGVVQMGARILSGGWDFVAALIPGQQEGMPMEPETLF